MEKENKELEEQIIQIEDIIEQKVDYKEKYLYLLAEYQNYKKRIIKQKEDLKNNLNVSILSPFLQIHNYFQFAKIAMQKTDNVDSLKQGVNMIINQFDQILKQLNVSKIKTIGEKFDYNFHNAIKYVPSDQVKQGYIISELKSGYKLNDDVIIIADVIVSAGKENYNGCE